MSGKQWALAIAGMIVVVPVAQFLGTKLGEAQNAPPARNVHSASNSSATEVVVSRQASEGITEADFNQDFLSNLEAWTVERTTANAEKYWDAANVPQSQRALLGESVLVERYGHQLAIVRIRIGETTPVATIVGIEGDELVRIGCIDRGGASVAITSGSCDAKIREVFDS